MSSSAPAPSSLPPIVRPRRSLPLGVAILAFLVGVYGFFVFVFGLLIVIKATLPAWLSSAAPGGSFYSLNGFAWGVVVTIIGLIVLGIGVALWRLRLWALVLGLLFLLFEMVTYAVADKVVSVGFILALIIFVYLLAVNRHFR